MYIVTYKILLLAAVISAVLALKTLVTLLNIVPSLPWEANKHKLKKKAIDILLCKLRSADKACDGHVTLFPLLLH